MPSPLLWGRHTLRAVGCFACEREPARVSKAVIHGAIYLREIKRVVEVVLLLPSRAGDVDVVHNHELLIEVGCLDQF
jgi:hypothetical protein